MPSNVEFAVYVPGDGFIPSVSLREANFYARDMLWQFYAGTRGPVWPPDFTKLGVYARLARPAGDATDLGWHALGLVKEVPGTRLERWPCPNSDCEHMAQFCTYCGGGGYVDQYGEPWGGDPAVSVTVRYEFDPVLVYAYEVERAYRPPVSPEFWVGFRNASLIVGGTVLVILALLALFSLIPR
jgi:hypothetical protein